MNVKRGRHLRSRELSVEFYNREGWGFIRRLFGIRRPQNMLFIYDMLDETEYRSANEVKNRLNLELVEVRNYLRRLWLHGYAERKPIWKTKTCKYYIYRLSSKKLKLENLYKREG